ncbi:MAG: hypothetical protein NZ699_08870 [Roseiflexus sp.]|nr:hypothetical protein [Roseiflexus sp.]MCS7289229.1 hypothetical protein [Roseiflexus sp.]MDW8146710.1 hypothetical protein [Roseiflexaceae bacterium]MDW8232642.1 hypothetical protein [Roseiflexaceae bacterium]
MRLVGAGSGSGTSRPATRSAVNARCELSGAIAGGSGRAVISGSLWEWFWQVWSLQKNSSAPPAQQFDQQRQRTADRRQKRAGQAVVFYTTPTSA